VRYAVVSDIHANLEALRVALEFLRPGDGLLCLGDIVGYGPNPNECVELIRERATATVLGNHDVAAIDDFGVAYFNPAARAAIRWTQSVLTRENATWLNGLSYELRMPDFLMVHGAPVRYFDYILDPSAAARAFAATDAPLVFIGHTHIAEYYALGPDQRIEHRHLQHGGALTLATESRYVVNVGSVGQPRDLNPRGSFAFYEPDARRIVWERFDYPIGVVQEKIDAAHLPPTLAARLVVGR
jgi:predicted phosphodiesterase